MVNYSQEDFVTGFFTDYLTGQECATVQRNGEEICITADEAYDILASQARDSLSNSIWIVTNGCKTNINRRSSTVYQSL